MNKAIRTGVEKGELEQPKGMSLLSNTYFPLMLFSPSARCSLRVFALLCLPLVSSANSVTVAGIPKSSPA